MPVARQDNTLPSTSNKAARTRPTPCAASQLKKRLRLIRRTITHPLVAERSSGSQPLPSRPHTLLHPGGEDLQLVCVYTSSTSILPLLESSRLAYLGPAGANTPRLETFSARSFSVRLSGGPTLLGRKQVSTLGNSGGYEPHSLDQARYGGYEIYTTR